MRKANSHISKQVLRQNHTVELPRVRDHDHRRRVYKHVVELEIRVVLLHHLGNGLPPEPRGGENVGLVDGVNGESGSLGSSNLASDSSDSFDFRDGVGHLVPSNSGSVDLLSISEVNSSDKLQTIESKGGREGRRTGR